MGQERADKKPEPINLKENDFSLKVDLINGWKPRVDLKNPFPLFLADSLTAKLSMRQDWVYRGFSPTNSYELHDAFSGSQSYTPKEHHLRVYRELISKQLMQKNEHIQPRSAPSSAWPQVEFDSFFESGNLAFVFRQESRFSLFLRIDSNTLGHTQWFYFSARSAGKFKAVFEIKNMSKQNSIFKRGGCPCYSLDNINWLPLAWSSYHPTASADLAEYFPPNYRRVNTLAFDFQFSESQLVYFAYSPPFTFSKLLSSIPLHLKKPLCTSEAGLEVPVLVYPAAGKPVIVVSARVHPGEACGSHMAQGIVGWLESQDNEARLFRQHFELHLVPMLNVEGVIAGNFRTGLAGDDLNRKYLKPNPLLHPSIAAFKKYVGELKKKRDIAVLLDLHGHSAKPNIFTYGPDLLPSDPLHDTARLFTSILAQNVGFFQASQCSWQIPRSKRGTARSVFIRSFGIKLCFTVEASTASKTVGDKLVQMTAADYHLMGRWLLNGLLPLLVFQTAPNFLPCSSSLALPVYDYPDMQVLEEGLEEGGSDSESGDEDYQATSKKKFLKELECFIRESTQKKGASDGHYPNSSKLMANSKLKFYANRSHKKQMVRTSTNRVSGKPPATHSIDRPDRPTASRARRPTTVLDDSAIKKRL